MWLNHFSLVVGLSGRIHSNVVYEQGSWHSTVWLHKPFCTVKGSNISICTNKSGYIAVIGMELSCKMTLCNQQQGGVMVIIMKLIIFLKTVLLSELPLWKINQHILTNKNAEFSSAIIWCQIFI